MPQTGTCSWIQNSKPLGRSQVTSTTTRWHAGRSDPPRLEFLFESCYNTVSIIVINGRTSSLPIQSKKMLFEEKSNCWRFWMGCTLVLIWLPALPFPPGTPQCPCIAAARYNLVLLIPWQWSVSPHFQHTPSELCSVMTNHRQGLEVSSFTAGRERLVRM